MLRNVFLRDSTEVKTPAKSAGSDRAGPRRKALVTEPVLLDRRWGPEGPRRQQVGEREWRGQAGLDQEGGRRQQGPEG